MAHRTLRRPNRALLGALAIGIALTTTACYQLASTALVMLDGPAWTGTGTRSLGGGLRSSLGLAGQDVYAFSPSGQYVLTAPFRAQFGGDHRLTSYVQTSVLGHHERELIHGNRVGRTDELRLLYRSHPQNAATWVMPSAPALRDGGDSFSVVQICGMAAIETREFISPDSPETRVFLSVRACNSARVCAGGVAQLEMDRHATRWWVRHTSATSTNSTLRRASGARFANECMPIAVTSEPTLRRHYLVVGAPASGELAIYDPTALAAGPIETWSGTDPSRSIRDVVITGRVQDRTDLAFVQVLWSGRDDSLLEHYSLVNGIVTARPFLSESLPRDVRFVESTGNYRLDDTGTLYSYGTNVTRRDYRR